MSDRRPYAKIPYQIISVPGSPRHVMALVFLQAWLGSRWARDRLSAEEAGRAILQPVDQILITRLTHATRARQFLLRLSSACQIGGLDVIEMTPWRPQDVMVNWPKFTEYQGFADRGRPQSGPKPGSSATASEQEHEPIPAPVLVIPLEASSLGGVQGGDKSVVCPWNGPRDISQDDKVRLADWAQGKGFTREQLIHGCERVIDWGQTSRKKRADWPRVVMNGMNEGWALRGYKGPPGKGSNSKHARIDEWLEKKKRERELHQD